LKMEELQKLVQRKARSNGAQEERKVNPGENEKKAERGEGLKKERKRGGKSVPVERRRELT